MYSSKNLTGRILLAVNFAGAVLFAVFLFYFIRPLGDRRVQNSLALPLENINTLPKQEQGSVGVPVRLKISGIGVDSAVESLGLTSAGAMDTPKGPDEVGWFKLGTRPGENGSAVIAGHYGTWKNGKGSVFDNLHKLSKGDKLSIEDADGASISFVVRESRSYEPGADASEIFSSSDGKAHLNLITCEGAWNKDAKSYPQRLVVFTDKEE
ncbi:MAG: class F sortase [Candidatus Moranbacteria bacterium]|nr:class F sortase [Candidatus Moranbacteria bacterium]